MERKCVPFAFLVIAMAAACGITASAQTAAQGAPAQKLAPASNMAETDMGVNIFRTFTGSTAGNTTLQTPSNGYGAGFELRHIQSPFMGYEATYSYSQMNIEYAPDPGACGFQCVNKAEKLSGNASLIGLDWIASMKKGNIRPFAVGGTGFFIAVPTTNLPSLNTIVRFMWTGGGGVDVGILPHAGLRIQYRDNFYKAPDEDVRFAATDKFTQTGQAMIGFYFHL
jgi:hypothetical protein